jgi:energy-coupling factor transport system substrate-specific component
MTKEPMSKEPMTKLDANRGFLRLPVGIRGALIILGLSLLSGAANAGLEKLNTALLQSPLFLDSILTVGIASLFGLIPGILTAVFTHFFMAAFNGWSFLYLPWVICSLASALITWSYVRWGLLRNPIEGISLALLVALANAVLGAAVAVFFFGGKTYHSVDLILSSLFTLTQNIFSAAFWARLPLNVVDKGIAVAVAMVARHLLLTNNQVPAPPSSLEEE